MRKIVISLMLLSVFQVSYSQTSVGTPEQIFNFSKTTTYVVLESNPMLMYNIRIKEAVEKHWDLTDYEFVTFSSDEFEKVRKDPTKSFLITNTVIFEKDKTKAKYKYLYVQLGGDYEFVNQMPKIAGIPIAYEGTDEDTYTYKLGMMVRFLQNHIKLTSQHPELNEKNIDKYYYKNMTGNLKDKILYVTKDDLAKGFDTMEDIKSIYPYKVKLVTRREIEQAIDDNDEDVVFVHKVGPEGSKRKARCVNILVGAADAHLYYFSWHMISDKKPEGLLKKDWKKLAKAKKKESIEDLEKEAN
jgi:hypothetical protein